MPMTAEFAFPFEQHQKFSITNPMVASQGLTKREYVAALALQGMLSNPQLDLSQLAGEPGSVLAQNALYVADQLLATISLSEEAASEAIENSEIN